MSARHPAPAAAPDLLFDGICAYFVEAGVQPRRLKIWCDKFLQFGGRLEDHCSHDVTHVFAVDFEKLQERFPLRKLKRHHAQFLNYEWIQDCLKEGSLLPFGPYVLNAEEKHKEQNAGQQHRQTSSSMLQSGKQISKDARASSPEKSATISSTEKSATISSFEIGSDDMSAEVISSSKDGEPSLTYLPPNLNQNITEPFSELRDIYKDALGDDRRSFSYHKAISVLEKLPFKIESIDQVKGLPTIGKSLTEHIYEILTTGKLPKLETFRNDEKVKILRLFSSVWGIGPATALKLYEKGHKSLNELETESSLTASQRIGLKFFDDMRVKIPREEVKDMEILVRQVAEDIQAGISVVCGGSYRRGKSLCSDMDFVITHPDGSSHEGFLTKLVAALREKDFLTETLLMSDTKIERTDPHVDTYFGLCKYPGRELRHRVDLKVYSIQMYPFGIIAWTGNDVLNRRLRLMADAKGYSLDDHGLFPKIHDSDTDKGKKKGPSLLLKTEREVFDFLGFPWLEPHERNL